MDLLPYVYFSKDIPSLSGLKILDRNALMGKCTVAIIFRNRELGLKFIRYDLYLNLALLRLAS